MNAGKPEIYQPVTRLINTYSNRLLEQVIFNDLEELLSLKTDLEKLPALNNQPRAKSAPIIVLGMHRSGTTLTSKLLRQIGVSMGRLKGDDTDESLFFQNVNKAIFKLSKSTWDQPMNLDSALHDFPYKAKLIAILTTYCSQSASTWPYFALDTFIGKNFFNTQNLWGWKDPRTCITLPIWLSIFPKAKIIFVQRNGVDVANSLVTRNKRFYGKPAYSEFTHTLEGAFKLWEVYNSICLRNLQKVNPTNLLNICYEDLLSNPKVNLQALTSFINADKNYPIEKLSSNVKKDRGYAFTSNRTLTDFYQSVKTSDMMKRFGYSELL